MSNEILDAKHNPRIYGLAYGLWFLTAALSVVVFMAGREIIIRTYVRFFPWDAWKFGVSQSSLSLINVMVSLPLAMMMIAVIIGGFEFQYRNMGKPQAWRLLARILAIEAGVLFLALYI